MARLEINFLGDLEVVRDGAPQALPPSRKTRALLAYLALSARSFRREHLCELLWEIPDDPRGSLRWSLSKLRRLVDDDDCARIIADRTHVRFDSSGVDIDVQTLHAVVAERLATAPLAELEAVAGRCSGHFLEGLELSNFHEFHSWWVAEREAATRAQTALLGAIVARLADEPERALPYARELAAVAPYDESAHASLIGLLIGLGRRAEAEQQYELGSRLLKEAGAKPSGALSRALRAETPPVAPAGPNLRPHPTAVAPRMSSGSLIGRHEELDLISTAIGEASAARQARLLLIRGEPGIGKSRLLAAAGEIAHESGARVVEASAFESEAIRPFAIWIDALRRHAPEAAEQIFGVGSGDNRERLLAGLSDFVASASQDSPLILLLDDVQWCDESSAAALHYVARTNRQRALVAILAARETELRDNAALQQALQGLRHAGLLGEIRLRPLPAADVKALIEERAPGADSAALSRECGGNPLLAIELARAELAGDSGASLDDLIRERLARFGIEEAEVLHWAAVLAPRIDVGRLERLTGLDADRIGRALDYAERQAILLPTEDGFRFLHDLVARSIYNEISPSRRRLMHRRVAELLERETAVDLEYAADLAHHAAHAGDPALAARAAVSAGRLCLRFFANDEALALARRGLGLVDRLADRDRICLTIDLKDVCLKAAPLDDWQAAVDEYVALAEQALDHGAMSHARLGYYMASYVRWMHGQWSGAHDEILQSERVSRGGTDEDHVVGMAEAARCLALLDRDLAQADAMLMEAQAIAARKNIVHHTIPLAQGMLRFHENELDRAESLLQEARTLAKQAGDRDSEFQVNEYLTMIDIERERYRDARARCDALLEIGTKLREGSEAPFARALAALCDYALDEETEALERAIDELRQVDAKHRLAYALTRAAMLDTERGRHARAIERATEALGYAEALDRATDKMLARVVLAEASRASKDREAFARYAASIAELQQDQVAAWVRARASKVLAA